MIDATSDLAIAYKPILAFYEVMGSQGFKSLKKTLKISLKNRSKQKSKKKKIRTKKKYKYKKTKTQKTKKNI